MGLRIKTNVQSLFAQRNLGLSTQGAGRSMAKLSSGYRITKAADDPAGLSISEQFRSDVRALAQAKRNANDGISLLQVAEGSLEEITNIIIRLRELSVQAATDTVGAEERGYLNLEFMSLKDEIDRIAVGTEYNGTRLLIGKKEVDPALLEDHNESPLEFQVSKDYMLPSDSLSSPNPVNIIRVNFGDMNASTSGEGGLGLRSPSDENGTRIDNKKDAQLTIDQLDESLNKVNYYRATIGAKQNRLSSTSRNLGVFMENINNAKSRIKDADFAEETSRYTQYNVLRQAGVSVLSQANQLPSMALKLLE